MSGRQPSLAGRRIVVTRRPEQSERLSLRLRELGATVIELPLIDVAPPLDTAPLNSALRDLRRYDWILFTSANAVRWVAARLGVLGVPRTELTSRKLASVGPATTEALREAFGGADVSVEAKRHDAEGLLDELAGRARDRRFLLPTSDRGRDALSIGLREAGGDVDVVVAYRTVAPDGLRERIGEALRGGADLVTLASPSAVENLAAATPELVPRLRAAVIGRITEEACRRAGLAVAVVAEPSTADGLVAALARHFARSPP